MAVNDKQVLTSINQVGIWFNFRLLLKIEIFIMIYQKCVSMLGREGPNK